MNSSGKRFQVFTLQQMDEPLAATQLANLKFEIIDEGTMIVENLKNFIDAAVQVAVGAQEGLQHYLCSPVVLTKRIVYAVLNLTLSYNSTVALDDWIQDAEMHTIVFQIRPEVTVAVKIRETQLSLPNEDIRVQINSLTNVTERAFIIRHNVFDVLKDPMQNSNLLRRILSDLGSYFAPYLQSIAERPKKRPRPRNPFIFKI